jgi:hypothetical protein
LASKYDGEQVAQTHPCVFLFGVIVGFAIFFCIVGTCTELSRFGDKVEYRRDIDKDVLFEASKFRRMEQYDSILL